MNSITARTINEIFINNLIKISVSIHAGTSSLTFAYGTPNHIINLNADFIIPFDQNNSNTSPFDISKKINSYYNGEVDNLTSNESTEPPDNQTLEGIFLKFI